MLRNGYTPGAEEWAIFDSDEFAGYEVGEYTSFDLVSLVARGVAEYGEACAIWVEHVGEQGTELLEERFRDHYHGTYDSVQAYVEEYLSESDAYSFMQLVPEHLQVYVSVDVKGYAQGLEAERLVVEELSDGRVTAFWTVSWLHLDTIIGLPAASQRAGNVRRNDQRLPGRLSAV